MSLSTFNNQLKRIKEDYTEVILPKCENSRSKEIISDKKLDAKLIKEVIYGDKITFRYDENKKDEWYTCDWFFGRIDFNKLA